MMHALNDLNMAICDVYGQMEASMKDTVMIALKICRRYGYDVIDGPNLSLQNAYESFFSLRVSTCENAYCTNSVVSAID